MQGSLGRRRQQRWRAEDVRPESGARRGSGSHRRGSCDLANRSLESEPSKTSPPQTPTPATRSRRASNARCPSRSVCRGPGWRCRATIRGGGCGGLFYIRIESAAETILTDFFSLSLFFFVAGSLGADVCLPRHETFGSGAVCHPVPSHASTFYYSLIIFFFPN